MISSKHFPAIGFNEKDAYRNVKHAISGDGVTERDLGSFTCTQMDTMAQKIYLENIDKNLVNVHEYESTSQVEMYLGDIIAQLLNIKVLDSVFSRSASGSSEAIGMAILMHKQKWVSRRKQETNNHPISGDDLNARTAKPNIVFCADAHLCWQKFAQYFDVEAREVPLRDDGVFPLDDVIARVDAETIVVVAIAGSTYTGNCDPIAKLCAALEYKNKEASLNVTVHVDAAVGGFALPFINENDTYIWDFRNPLVESINVSNHKFGLVYPGLGWLVFNKGTTIAQALSYNSNYLLGESQSFSLNFSRPAAPVLVQYYNFQRYGIQGYSDVINRCKHLAKVLAELLEASKLFRVVSDLTLPVVAFSFIEVPKFKISEYVCELRKLGWMLPCYTLKTPSETVVMRIVVRNSSQLSDYKVLCEDLVRTQVKLNKNVRKLG